MDGSLNRRSRTGEQFQRQGEARKGVEVWLLVGDDEAHVSQCSCDPPVTGAPAPSAQTGSTRPGSADGYGSRTSRDYLDFDHAPAYLEVPALPDTSITSA